MRKEKDEEQQKLIFDDDARIVGDEESGCYSMLKNILETEPCIVVPEDFAQRATQKAFRKKQVYEAFKSTTLYFGALTVVVAVAALALFFLAKDVFQFVINGVQVYKVPVIFALLIFGLVQITDEIFVKKRIVRH